MFKGELPYFDFLLSQFKKNNTSVLKSFGEHVHWGYWPDSKNSTPSYEGFHQAQEELSKLMCQMLALKDGEALLDVGCGFGGTISLVNRLYHHMSLTGVNIDKRQIDRARRQVSAKNENTIAFKVGHASKLPFEDNQFDKVIAVECIFHFPRREDFIREAFRVLKPNGLLVISDFVPTPLALPLCSVLAKEKFKRYNFWGLCNINYTEKKYQQLAHLCQLNLDTLDITTNTLPTYDHLKMLLLESHLQRKSLRYANAMIALTKCLVKTKQFKYQLMKFEKSKT